MPANRVERDAPALVIPSEAAKTRNPEQEAVLLQGVR